MNRRSCTLIITKRLIILTGIGLACVGALFSITFLSKSAKFMVSWVCLVCGFIGGFVSIQQRLPKVSDDELDLLAGSWFQILLVPIYGGIFALILYTALLSGIVDGKLFPAFYKPPLPSDGSVTRDYLVAFFTKTYPASGEDLAKLIIWSFIAGFSERFVPQIIADITPKPKT